jgi:hypothetical protein
MKAFILVINVNEQTIGEGYDYDGSPLQKCKTSVESVVYLGRTKFLPKSYLQFKIKDVRT